MADAQERWINRGGSGNDKVKEGICEGHQKEETYQCNQGVDENDGTVGCEGRAEAINVT